MLRVRRKVMGVSGLSAKRFKQLAQANVLTRRAIEIARAVGRFVFEHPPDRGSTGSRLYRRRYMHHAPIWLVPEMLTLRLEFGADTIDFAQCALGGSFQKWTTLLFTPDMAEWLEPFRRAVCTHEPGEHLASATGLDAEGLYKSRESAAYPGRMIRMLVEAGALASAAETGDAVEFEGRTFQGDGVALHVGSNRPHALDGDHARVAPAAPSSDSLRRLEPAPEDELRREPFPYTNVPPAGREWAEAPATDGDGSAAPGPLTDEQLFMPGVQARLRKFSAAVGKCFAAARGGRWRWARDHRPEAIVLSEDEAMRPVARGRTWLWDDGSGLWHAVSPTSYPSDPALTELLVERMNAYGRYRWRVRGYGDHLIHRARLSGARARSYDGDRSSTRRSAARVRRVP